MSRHARDLPSVDEILRSPLATAAVARYGRTAVVETIRSSLARYRTGVRDGSLVPLGRSEAATAVAAEADAALVRAYAPHLRRVFNLTGTVLHTNLGRAVLPEAAI